MITALGNLIALIAGTIVLTTIVFFTWTFWSYMALMYSLGYL